MKRNILSLVIGAALMVSALVAQAGTATVVYTLGGNTSTNTLPVPSKITAMSLMGTDSNNVSVALVDAPALALTYTLPAYTNTYTYLTNLETTYTNFFGVVNSFTNAAIVDVPKSNGAVTVNYTERAAMSVSASNTVTANSLNYFFWQGILITNTSVGAEKVTLTYTY